MKHHNKKRNYFILILICWNIINSILIAKTIDSLPAPELHKTPIVILESGEELDKQIQEELQFEILTELN